MAGELILRPVLGELQFRLGSDRPASTRAGKPRPPVSITEQHHASIPKTDTQTYDSPSTDQLDEDRLIAGDQVVQDLVKLSHTVGLSADIGETHQHRHNPNTTATAAGPGSAAVATVLLASAAMATPVFDLQALFEAMNAQRDLRSLSWAALSRRIGVAASTIRRFATADDAEADGVLAALQWLDAVPEHYIPRSNIAGTRLPPASDAHVRVDMQLIAQANDGPRGVAGRTRTTIQNLAAAAERSGRPIASLTRLTEL